MPQASRDDHGGVSLRVLGRVAARLSRGAAFATILLALLFARTASSPVELIIAIGVGAVALFALGRTRTGYVYYVAYISGLALFAVLRSIADDTGIGFKGQYSVDIERRLFGGTLPTEWLQDRLFDAGKVGVIAVICAVVYVSYFFATHIVALGFWRRHPAEFKRYALAVLLTGYTGLAIMFLVPTVPPWLASEHSDAPRMTRVLGDAFGWNPEQAGQGMTGGNPIAAMPSLHSAVTVLVVLALWRWRKLRAPALLYLAAMWFTLVYCGEHYVIDLLLGAAVAVTAWVVSTRLIGPPKPLQPVERSDRGSNEFGVCAEVGSGVRGVPHREPVPAGRASAASSC
jgi:membrane-associated phospholipid phosphatase